VTTTADEFVLRLAQAKGLFTEEQLAAARADLAARDPLISPRVMIDMLIATGVLDDRRLTAVLATEFGLNVVELDGLAVSKEVLALVPRTLAIRYRLVPVRLSERVLHVAISDPTNMDGVDSLAHMLGMPVEALVATSSSVFSAIDRLYGADGGAPEILFDAAAEDESIQPHSRTDHADGNAQESDADAPIIKLVHSVIHDAIRRRASDIHLEPLEKKFRVRYRVDGVLIEAENPPKRLQLAVISRVKLMANISIAEKRIPQDGRIQITSVGQSIDLRVSSLPTAHGESIVMRILDQRGLKLGLPELGFLPDDRMAVERFLSSPDGIVLVTGPTGSGKTTTLYSCLHQINTPARKIITVEDPVEYQLKGVNQVPVRHDVGMTFASALRAMLRQAPNVVMVGEIRDLETAEIAINASLTGHLVFSTLHTNDAPGAVTRLIDIGVKPFLVSASLRTVIAQRLVRKNCEKCRRPSTPLPATLRAVNLSSDQLCAATFMQGAGCVDCNGTGFRGRIGIFEILVASEEIQRLIYEGVGCAGIRDKARSSGMRTMREDGARKASSGLTTVEEVVSITVGDAD
jgi:general secretion pathway protein E/type IV pilus assembly protein PilB